MLPYFAASGHNNYSKCVRLYLQESSYVCGCLRKAMSNRLFTIRRNPSLFWSATWTDMTIEQCMMRSGTITVGLINITNNDAARAKWLLSVHILAQYTESLQCLTGTVTGTWSKQHREMEISRTKKDKNDVIKFLKFLTCHNPFNVDKKDVLLNIATGIIANREINIDEAVQIGKKIHQDLDDTKFIDIKFVKAKLDKIK